MKKTTLNPFENAKRTREEGGGVSPAIIEEMQAEISVLGSENGSQAQDITDIKNQLTELAGAYSTTEHKTGRKWIDCKDIYEKVIVFESQILVTTNWTDTTESKNGYDTIVKAYANTNDGNAYSVDCIKGTTYIQLKRYTDGNVKSITLEYTKTGE